MVQIRINKEILPSVADALRPLPFITNPMTKPAAECTTTEKVSVGEVLSVIDAGHSESVCDTDIIQVERVSIRANEGDYLRAESINLDVDSDSAEGTISDDGSDTAIEASSTLPIPIADNRYAAVPRSDTIPTNEPTSYHVEVVDLDSDQEVAESDFEFDIEKSLNESDDHHNSDISSRSVFSSEKSVPVGLAPASASAPLPLPSLCSISSSSWETVDVPEKLSSPVFETKLLSILLKVKEQSKLISATLSTDPMTTEVCVLIEAPSAESAVLAKKLIEKHFKQKLVTIDAERDAEEEAEKKRNKIHAARREAEEKEDIIDVHRVKSLEPKSTPMGKGDPLSTSSSTKIKSSSGKKRGRPSKADVASALALKTNPGSDKVSSGSTDLGFEEHVHISYWSSTSADADDVGVISEYSVPSSVSATSSFPQAKRPSIPPVILPASSLGVKRKSATGPDLGQKRKIPIASAPSSSSLTFDALSGSSSSSSTDCGIDNDSSSSSRSNSSGNNRTEEFSTKPIENKDTGKGGVLIINKKHYPSLPDDSSKVEVCTLALID